MLNVILLMHVPAMTLNICCGGKVSMPLTASFVTSRSDQRHSSTGIMVLLPEQDVVPGPGRLLC